MAEACLTLQERLGIDVNLLLFCLWAGRCGRRLGGAELVALKAAAGPWHEAVVRPLRGVRRWLKGQAESEPFRQEVKQLELEAERHEQDLLHARLPLAPSAADLVAARANLRAYLGEDAPEVEVLLAALD